MVKQGDIIKINFNPQVGHEQAGYRPAVVVSNNFFNKKTNLTFVCPITNTVSDFPLHVKLDERTITTGVILCEHLKALEINKRTYKIGKKYNSPSRQSNGYTTSPPHSPYYST